MLLCFCAFAAKGAVKKMKMALENVILAFAALAAALLLFSALPHKQDLKPVPLIALGGTTQENEAVADYAVRPAAVAGEFYPASPVALEAIVSEYLGKAKALSLENVKGLIVPHAGYAFSGQAAAQAFRHRGGYLLDH